MWTQRCCLCIWEYMFYMKRYVLCGLSWIWEFTEVSRHLMKSAIWGVDDFHPWEWWSPSFVYVRQWTESCFFERKKEYETIFTLCGPWRKAPQLWWWARYVMSRLSPKQLYIQGFCQCPSEQISELNIFAFSKLAMILSDYPEFFKCFKKIQLTYLVNLIFLIRKDWLAGGKKRERPLLLDILFSHFERFLFGR